MTKTLIAAAFATAVLAGEATAASAGPMVPALEQQAASDIVRADHRRHWHPHHRPHRQVLPSWRVVGLLHRHGYRHCRGGLTRGGVYAMHCLSHGRIYALRVSAWDGHVMSRRFIG